MTTIIYYVAYVSAGRHVFFFFDEIDSPDRPDDNTTKIKACEPLLKVPYSILFFFNMPAAADNDNTKPTISMALTYVTSMKRLLHYHITVRICIGEFGYR